MKNAYRFSAEFLSIIKAPLDAYGATGRAFSLLDSSFCRYFGFSCAHPFHRMTLAFALPPQLHDVGSLKYALEVSLFKPLLCSLTGSFSRLLIDALVDFSVEVRPLALLLHLHMLSWCNEDLNAAVSAVLSAVFNYAYYVQNLSSQQLKALQGRIWAFNERTKAFERFLRPQEYRYADLQELSRVLVSESLQYATQRRFLAFATSNDDKFLESGKDSIQGFFQRAPAHEVLPGWRFECSKLSQASGGQMIVCEKIYQEGQAAQFCDVRCVTSAGDVFGGILATDSLSYLAMWLADERGPLNVYLRYVGLPEYMCNSLQCGVVYIEKYLFLEITVARVPEEFADALVRHLEDAFRRPRETLLGRGMEAFYLRSARQAAYIAATLDFHPLIVDDCLYLAFDGADAAQAAVEPQAVYGALEALRYQKIAKIIDFWTWAWAYERRSAIQTYLGIPANKSALTSITIEAFEPPRGTQDGRSLSAYARRQLLPLLIALGRSVRSANLLAYVLDAKKHVEALITRLFSQYPLISVFVGPRFFPQTVLFARIAPHRRMKSSLTDEAVEIFQRGQVKTSYFDCLAEMYRGAIGQSAVKLRLDEYAKNAVVYSNFAIYKDEVESNFQHFPSVETDAELSQAICGALEAYRTLTSFQKRLTNEQAKDAFYLSGEHFYLLSKLIIDQYAHFPRDCKVLQVCYFRTPLTAQFDPRMLEVWTQGPESVSCRVSLTLTALFDVSFVPQDLQYVLVVLAEMLNRRQALAHFEYYDDVLYLVLESPLAQLFRRDLQRVLAALYGQFTVDDFAFISRLEAFLGVAQLLQTVAFAGSDVRYTLRAQCHGSYIENPDGQLQELFNTRMRASVRLILQEALAALHDFDGQLRKLFQPAMRSLARKSHQNRQIRSSSEQLLLRARVVQRCDLEDYQTALLQAFYGVVFSLDPNVAEFSQRSSAELHYILNELRADTLNTQSFILFLTIQGLQSQLLNRHRLAALARVLYHREYLAAFDSAEDVDAVLRLCPLNVDIMHLTVVAPNAATDHSLEGVVNQEFKLCVAHEFNLQLDVLPSVFCASIFNNSIVPKPAAKLISQMQNLVFEGIKRMSDKSVGELCAQELYLEAAKAKTSELQSKYRERLSECQKPLFKETRRAIYLPALRQQANALADSGIFAELTLTHPCESTPLLALSKQLNTYGNPQKRRKEMLAAVIDAFPIANGCINGVPLMYAAYDVKIRKLWGQTTLVVGSELARQASEPVRPLLNGTFFAYETAEMYVCTALQWVARIFGLQLRHEFVFPLLLLLRSIPKCAVPVALPLCNVGEYSTVRELFKAKIKVAMHPRAFGPVLPLAHDYLSYSQQIAAIYTAISENIAFIAAQIRCDLSGCTSSLDALQRVFEFSRRGHDGS